MTISQRSWPVDRRTILKSTAAIAAVQFSSPFIIKARGEGLYCPLDQFDVSVTPDVPAMLLESRVDPADTERWIFNEIFAGERYAATVAVEKKFSRLVLWDFLEEGQAGTGRQSTLRKTRLSRPDRTVPGPIS